MINPQFAQPFDELRMPLQQEVILADGQPEKLELLIDLLGTGREWI